MVHTHTTAVEARLEEVERKLESLSHMERGQEELRQMFMALSNQIREFLHDRGLTHTSPEIPDHGAPNPP